MSAAATVLATPEALVSDSDFWPYTKSGRNRWIVSIPTGDGGTDNVTCTSAEDALALSVCPRLLRTFRTADDVTEVAQLENLKRKRDLLKRYGRGSGEFYRWLEALIAGAKERLEGH